MSEVRLVVREAGRDWSGRIYGSFADKAIAALSADPVTMEEFELAAKRYAHTGSKERFFQTLSPDLNDEPHDAGLVVIDLAARLICADSTWSSLGMRGSVEYHDGLCGSPIPIEYHLADEWLISTDRNTWRSLAEKRRQERAAQPVRDARAVFYGRPMLEFVARNAFAAFARREPIADAFTRIHAEWLLTPCAELGGACPREIACAGHNHLVWDMQYRQNQWSRMGACPRGLAETSHAFRYAGVGTHEWVLHYDLVRDALSSCWGKLTALEKAEGGLESLTAGDFLAIEIPLLERVRESWFDSPASDCHGKTPRQVIDQERARLPQGMSGKEAMIDDDCPLCQMLGDETSVGFWSLDGCNMDDEFAFHIHCRTREDWEKERRDSEEHSRRFDAERAERKRLGVTDSPGEDGSTADWSRSFATGSSAEVPLGVRIFGFGGLLAGLMVGLRAGADRESTPPETKAQIDRLNRDFGNLREILKSTDVSLAEALVDPVRDRFAETLATIAASRPDVASECKKLTEQLQALLNPPSPEFDIEFPDLGSPF